eukprot:sb/3466428/
MAIFSEGGTTSPDFPLFLILLLLPCISIPLNLLVLKDNYKKQPSIARTLHFILGSFDLLSVPVVTISTAESAVGVFAEKVDFSKIDDPSLNGTDGWEYYRLWVINPSPAQMISFTINWALIYAPQTTTAVLTACRFFQIRYPLRQVSKKLVLTLLLIPVLYIPVINGIIYTLCETLDGQTYYVIILQWALPRYVFIGDVLIFQSPLMIIITMPCIIVQLVGLVFTVATIVHLILLQRNPIVKRQSNKGTYKILIIHAGSITTFLFFIGATVVNYLLFTMVPVLGSFLLDHVFLLVAVVVVPLLCSLHNPIVYLAMKPKERRRVTPVGVVMMNRPPPKVSN